MEEENEPTEFYKGLREREIDIVQHVLGLTKEPAALTDNQLEKMIEDLETKTFDFVEFAKNHALFISGETTTESDLNDRYPNFLHIYLQNRIARTSVLIHYNVKKLITLTRDAHIGNGDQAKTDTYIKNLSREVRHILEYAKSLGQIAKA